MKYLILGDIHLSDRPPSMCTDEYLDDLFTILEHTVRLETDLGIDGGVIWSGDVWHHKQPSRTSHRTVQRAIALVQRYKRLWVVPGNHDMLNDRYESLFESQPLGVLFQAGAELLNGWESTGEHPLYGLPWKQSWTEDTIGDAFADWSCDTIWPEDKRLVVTHAPLYPPGIENPFEFYPARDEADRMGWATLQEFGYCYYGHVHDHHGVWREGNVTFCNQGAITRGSLRESDLTRAIAVTTWSPDEGFIRIDVPHKPADQVFRLMEARERDDQIAEAAQFLDQVGQAQLEITSVESVIAYVDSLVLDGTLPQHVAKVATEMLRGEHGG